VRWNPGWERHEFHPDGVVGPLLEFVM